MATLEANTQIFEQSRSTAIGAPSGWLRVGKNISGSEERVYVRFEVRNMVSIQQAVLRLFIPTNGTNASPSVALGSDAWEPSTLTWDNACALGCTAATGPLLGTLAPTKAGKWASIDVTTTLTASGNGIYTFVLFQTVNTTDNVTFTTPELHLTGLQNPDSALSFAATGPDAFGSLDGTLVQSSGLAASHRFGNTYYTHNDQDIGKVFAVRNTGALRGTMQPSGANITGADFEDVSVGPGPNALTSYVYLADIGNNKHVSKDYRILRFPEPSSFNNSTTPAAVAADVLFIGFPATGDLQGDHLNAEAIIIDPVTGSLWVIEKPCKTDGIPPNTPDPQGYSGKNGNRIYYLEAPLHFGNSSSEPAMMTQNGGVFKNSMPVDQPNGDTGTCNTQDDTAKERVTGAGITVIGDRVAVTFYNKIYFWYRPAGTDLGTVLNWYHPNASEPLVLTAPLVGRESITFSRTSLDGYFTTIDTNGGFALREIATGFFSILP